MSPLRVRTQIPLFYIFRHAQPHSSSYLRDCALRFRAGCTVRTACLKQAPEQQIHAAVVAHLRLRGVDGLVILHPNNNVHRAGRAGIIQGAQAKRMGVLAGASDLLLFHAGQFFALELKAEKGRVTSEQDEFIAAIRDAGGFAWCAKGLDEALITLRHWGLIK